MASPAVFWNDVAECLECAICLERLRDPRSLPCQHTFCGGCLARVAASPNGNELSCPSCRQRHTVSVSSLPQNLLAVQLLDAMDKSHEPVERTCEDCPEDPGKASKFCEECRLYLCEVCIRHHMSSKKLRQHTMVSLSALDEQGEPQVKRDQFKREPICDTHDGERVEAYCTTHEKAICSKCTLVNHRSCPFLSLQEACDLKVETIQQSIAELQDRVVTPLREAVKLNKDQQETLAMAAPAMSHKIKEDFSRLRSLLDSCEEEMLARVETKWKQDKETLQQNLSRIRADLHRVQQAGIAAEDLIRNHCRTSILSQAQAALDSLMESQVNTEDVIQLGNWQADLLEYTPLQRPSHANSAAKTVAAADGETLRQIATSNRRQCLLLPVISERRQHAVAVHAEDGLGTGQEERSAAAARLPDVPQSPCAQPRPALALQVDDGLASLVSSARCRGVVSPRRPAQLRPEQAAAPRALCRMIPENAQVPRLRPVGENLSRQNSLAQEPAAHLANSPIALQQAYLPAEELEEQFHQQPAAVLNEDLAEPQQDGQSTTVAVLTWILGFFSPSHDAHFGGHRALTYP